MNTKAESALSGVRRHRARFYAAGCAVHSGRKVKLSDAYTRQANDCRAMALASRCESRFQLMYQSLYKLLRELQASRATESAPTQPEPAAKPQSAETICGNKPKAVVISNPPPEPESDPESDANLASTKENSNSEVRTRPPI